MGRVTSVDTWEPSLPSWARVTPTRARWVFRRAFLVGTLIAFGSEPLAEFAQLRKIADVKRAALALGKPRMD